MTTRICSREGCCVEASTRGMCRTHYATWRRANPEKVSMRVNEQTILDAMPGTFLQLMERTGLSRDAVRRALGVLNVKGKKRQAYIKDYTPPSSKGKRWIAIWESGREKDYQLTDERKVAHTKMLRTACDARRRPRKTPKPVPRACWSSVLRENIFVGIEKKESRHVEN